MHWVVGDVTSIKKNSSTIGFNQPDNDINMLMETPSSTVRLLYDFFRFSATSVAMLKYPCSKSDAVSACD